MERDLSQYDFVALFIDGKSFAEDEMIIALGVTITGGRFPWDLSRLAPKTKQWLRIF